jgi:hypothetical protein
MASLYIWTNALVGYRMEVKEPIRPFALSYLAASGMFDKLVIERSDGVRIEVQGADLLRCADQVAPVKAED